GLGEAAGQRLPFHPEVRGRRRRGDRAVRVAEAAGDERRVPRVREGQPAVAPRQGAEGAGRRPLPAALGRPGIPRRQGAAGAAGGPGELVRGECLLRIHWRPVADLERMGIRRRGRRDPPRRTQGPGLARTHPGLVFATFQPGPAPRRPAGAQRLRRAGLAWPGLGMDRRLLVIAGRPGKPQPGRSGQIEVLWCGRPVDGRPRQLCGADARGHAVLDAGPGHHRQPRVPMRQERRQMKFLIAIALAIGFILPAGAAELPSDSVYQLPLQLTDQHGKTWDWGSRRGKPQVVAMFYASCRYICPLIIESGKAVDRSLTPGQRAGLGVIYISMDPERDTPAALAKLAEERKITDKRWALASPKPADVRSVAGVLDIRYRQLSDGEF